jgi:hypothetical protein
MKTTPPLEKDIEAAVCKYARERGCLVYKFTSPSQRAVPDRLFVLPYGGMVFLEFKRPGQKPTPLQQRELLKLQDQGVRAAWCDSIQQGKHWLNNRIAEGHPL